MLKSNKWRKKIRHRDVFLNELLPEWRRKNEKLVFTNGCFDLLHAGHIENLAEASQLGDRLIIGVNSDASVKRLKQAGRPVQNESDRCLLLASLVFTDAVILFDEDTPQKLIEDISPDVLVKGGDYKVDEISGSDWVIRNHGSVVLIPLVPDKSTSNLVHKIKKMK